MIVRYGRIATDVGLGLSALLVADGLRSQPGGTQAALLGSSFFPWAFLFVGLLSLLAATSDLLRRSTAASALGLLSIALLVSTAVMRGVLWANEQGAWTSRSIWPIWGIMTAMGLKVFLAAWRVHEEGIED